MGVVCFDLDGTLTDPLRAMVHCVGLACGELGIQAPPREAVAPFVGAGAADLFARLPGLEDPARRDEAVGRYWAHYEASGVGRHRTYEGIPLLLTRLKRQGHLLYLVTVKPARLARRILHEFDLLLCFEEVFGTVPGGPEGSKRDVIAELRAQGIVQPGATLVGDRADDMASARANGLIPLGVTYGFGTEEELREAGARDLVASPRELDEWFKVHLPGSEILDAFSRSE
jgi:phosphoglycolate phosphatase